MLKKVKSLESFLYLLEKWFLVALLSFMVTMAFLQVVLRQAFSSGFLWADTLLRHLVLWVGFLGAAIATMDEKHFSLDAITHPFPVKIQKGLKALTHIFASGVCLILTNASFRFLKDEKEAGGILFTAWGKEIPAWTLEIILPVGFLLLSTHLLIKMLQVLLPPSPSQ